MDKQKVERRKKSLALQILADMLSSHSKGDVFLIEQSLVEDVLYVERLVTLVDGKLESRQAVAIILHQWMKGNAAVKKSKEAYAYWEE